MSVGVTAEMHAAIRKIEESIRYFRDGAKMRGRSGAPGRYMYGTLFDYDKSVILDHHNIWTDPTSRIDGIVKIEAGEGVYIGPYVHLASFVHILGGGVAVLEDGASCGSGVRLITGSNVPGPGHGCSAIAPDAIVKRSFIHIKRNATIFAGATVLPGVTIGEGAVVGACSFVNRDVPDGETWVGNPARPIKRTIRADYPSGVRLTGTVVNDRFVDATIEFLDECRP